MLGFFNAENINDKMNTFFRGRTSISESIKPSKQKGSFQTQDSFENHRLWFPTWQQQASKMRKLPASHHWSQRPCFYSICEMVKWVPPLPRENLKNIQSSSLSAFLLMDFHTHNFYTYAYFFIVAQTTSWTHREHLCWLLSNTPKA